jgi:hypothetical protein
MALVLRTSDQHAQRAARLYFQIQTLARIEPLVACNESTSNAFPGAAAYGSWLR